MKITVAGGGISGLSSAYRLAELARMRGRDLQIMLAEKSESPGGVISTKSVDDLLIEEGPDSVLTKNASVPELADKLGIKDQLVPTKSENRKVYVFINGELKPLPDGFYMMAPTDFISFLRSPLFTVSGKARISLETVIPPRKDDSDESLYSFVTRRFGTEALERVVQPLLSGIYTARPERLSLKATMPQFVEMEKKYGSVIRGLRKSRGESYTGDGEQSGARYNLFVSFRNGMSTLVDGIVSALPEGTVETGRCIESINRDNSGWKMVFSDGSDDHSDGVVLALPAFAASSALSNYDEELSSLLGGIEYLSSSVVNLVYRKESVKKLPRAFGVLVPSVEKRDVIAFSFLSEKLENRAPDDLVVIRCFTGGDLNSSANELEDEELITRCIREVKEILGADSPPEYKFCRRYNNSMPLYGIGHLDRVEKINKKMQGIRGLSLAGSAYGGVGIPDCVSSGILAAEKVFSEVFGDQ